MICIQSTSPITLNTTFMLIDSYNHTMILICIETWITCFGNILVSTNNPTRIRNSTYQ